MKYGFPGVKCRDESYFFYDGWEIIEERDGNEAVYQQYVYGPNHIDEMVMVRGTNGAFFAYQDANWNVMGLTNPTGAVAEEYNYTPYGRLVAKRHYAFGDDDLDGDVDAADSTAFTSAMNTSEGDPGWNRDFDADYDGDIDSFDQTAFNAVRNPAGDSRVVANRAWSPGNNPIGFTGCGECCAERVESGKQWQETNSWKNSLTFGIAEDSTWTVASLSLTGRRRECAFILHSW